MKNTFSFIKNAGNGWAFAIIVVLMVFSVMSVVQAATTISTNIVTEGTLQVDGSSTLGDAVSDSVTANAYFTQLRIGTGSTFGHISTVGADELGVEGDVEVDGTAYFDGLASTTQLSVGTTAYVSTISGISFGTCAVDLPSITASTTAVADCSATGVAGTSDRIFVTPASSTNNIIFTSASATGAGTIQVAAFNAGWAGAVNPDVKIWSWMAIR
jgi:hypothetical protein